MTAIEADQQVQLGQTHAEPDSDTEDDPGKLLNAWLGQLNQKVTIFENYHLFKLLKFWKMDRFDFFLPPCFL